ncbi:MAG: diacylglycerol kinase [Parvularcula sp.]|jgi:diacylglycerol kinase (ATP)|nr:diacylglycerol kinase [Parvularcula sp.]
MAETTRPKSETPLLDGASAYKSKDGLSRMTKALGYSLEGLGSALKHEAAFRQETIAAVILIPLACVLPVPILAKCILIGVVLQALVVELLNSAVEWAVDYISTDKHPMAKRAKDIGSAAVLLSIAWGLTAWVLIVIEHWAAISAWAGLT